MAIAKGSKGQLLLDFETTYNQDPTTPAGVLLPFNNESIVAQQNLTNPATITGSRNPVQPIKGNTDVSGSITIPVDQIATGYWIKALFGSPNTTDNLNGTYTHVFTVSETQPSLVIEKGFTDIGQYFKYNGCKINQFSMDFGGDGELTASIDIVGSKETVSSTPYNSGASKPSFIRFNNFQATIEEGGSVIGDITEGNFAISANLDTELYTIGNQGTRGDLPEGVLNITGSITVLFKDMSLLNKAINTTESSIKIKFSDGTHYIEFYFPEIIYNRNSPTISGPNGVLVTLNWQAYYKDNADSTSCKITLLNTKSAY